VKRDLHFHDEMPVGGIFAAHINNAVLFINMLWVQFGLQVFNFHNRIFQLDDSIYKGNQDIFFFSEDPFEDGISQRAQQFSHDTKM
jgi:hypothetical protein